MIGERIPLREGAGDDLAELEWVVNIAAHCIEHGSPHRAGSLRGTASVSLAHPARMGETIAAQRIGEVVALVAKLEAGWACAPTPVARVTNDVPIRNRSMVGLPRPA